MSEVYFDPTKVGSYGGVAGLRRVTRLPQRAVKAWLSAQDAYTLHKPARRHFKRRRVIVGGMHQQWQADLVDMTKVKDVNDGYGLSPHGDRRLLESGLVCSHEEQVRGIVGKSAAIQVRRRLPPDLADGSRQRISEQIRSGAIEALRHPLLLHAQRGDEGSRRGTVQPNVEDAHVALLHETPDVAVHRRPSGLDAIV